MMTRQLHFDGTKAAERFDLLHYGFAVGEFLAVRVDLRGAAQPRDERRTDVAILRALKGVSEPDDAPKMPLAPDTHIDARKLVPGSTLVLSQVELDRLMKLLDRVPWTIERIEAAEDLLDWLAAADKVE